MAKTCDTKATGVLVWDRNGRLLLIERKKYSPGFACPAGHNDGDAPSACAVRETREEVGLYLQAIDKKLVYEMDNPCGRGSQHHSWTVFNVLEWQGEIKTAEDEVLSYRWADKDMLLSLARRTERFAMEMGLSFGNVSQMTEAANASDKWKKDPGLEPAWYILLREMSII